MKNFRTSLSSALLDAASFPLGHKESYSWTNTPPSMGGDRGGIRFGALSEDQLNLFYEVLNVFLSDDGYTKVSLITKDVETHLSTIRPGFWDSDFYHIALFGNPETDGSWGFQLDGHHLALNFLVHGDEVSIVPAFIGSEPATINGIEVLEDERGQCFRFTQQSRHKSKRESDSNRSPRTPSGSGQIVRSFPELRLFRICRGRFEGIRDENTQKEHLRNLIKTYVYNLETEFADIWMADIDAGLDDTYFVWIGGTTTDDAIYYRVFNPAVWIEFNNEGGVKSEARSWSSSGPHPYHYPIAERKDYGIFALNHGPKTLLEHYTSADHHKVVLELFDYHIDEPQDADNTETP